MDQYKRYGDWKGWCTGSTGDCSDLYEVFERELRGFELGGKRVHEIGFGSGDFLNWIRLKRGIVSGVEVQSHLVESAQSAGLPVELVATDGTIGTLPADSVDLVVAFDVLEHLSIEQIGRALSEAAVVLRKGGLFMARFPNGASPLSGLYQYGDITHKTTLTPTSLAQLTHCNEIPLRLHAARDSAVPVGRNPKKALIRIMRYGAQRGINFMLSSLYFGRAVPLGPNVTVTFKRS